MNRTVIARTTLIAAIVVGGAACGGSDDASEPEGNDDGSETAATDAPDAPDAPAADASDAPASGGSGNGNGTLTLDDGTVYTFEMSTCETSDTDPDSFLVDPGFDAFGRTSDGFTLQLIRAAFEESPDLQPTVGFEGSYDENGVNPEIQYLRDGDADLQIDGGRIFGEVTFTDFFSIDPIHGEGFVATVDVDC